MDLTNPAELLEQIPEFAEELMEPEDCFPEGKSLHVSLQCWGKKPSFLLLNISQPSHHVALLACSSISLDALRFLGTIMLQTHTQNPLLPLVFGFPR